MYGCFVNNTTFHGTKNLKSLEKLLENGILGFYNSIEVTEIFAVNSKKELINIFTLMVAEERQNYNDEIKSRFLTEKLFTVHGLNEFKFGIKQTIYPIDDILKKMDNFTEGKTWDEKLKKAENIKLTDKKFAPPDSMETIPVNSILKNNFNNGSYIIEWFDQDKKNTIHLLEKPHLLQDISSEIQKYVPIAIGALSDRLGNYILQIPIDILQARFVKENTENINNLKCDIS